MRKIMNWGTVAVLLSAACGSDGGGGTASTGGTGGGGTGSGGRTEVGGVMGTGGATATGGGAGTGAGGAAMDGGDEVGSCAAEAIDGGGAWLALPKVPPALAVPAGATLKLHDRGVGEQIYTCTASGGGDGGTATYAWVLKAPDAELFDACEREVGTHGSGPHWTSTVDGSTVNGAKAMQADAPVATAIPWLLLRATSTTGSGVFSDVTYIQRVNTAGGKAPAVGCDATTVGAETSVAYSADYYFYAGGAGAAWLSEPVGVPVSLAVPIGATLKLHERGIGAQVYTCTASPGADGGAAAYAWVLKAPDAMLYDATFAQVGVHGAGPTWTSTDGSAIKGTRLAQADAPLADAIPWLLLQASATGSSGVLDDIAYVQRLDTAGGKAPATGCDGSTVGSEARVDYSADYYFFTGVVMDGGALDH